MGAWGLKYVGIYQASKDQQKHSIELVSVIDQYEGCIEKQHYCGTEHHLQM